ncbi:MAG: hypothetical protein Q7S84_02160 [bacterium]|nr:hypothetical protein [bacterium]
MVCFILGLVSLAGWLQFQGEQRLIQYALYTAIVADSCAAIPTIMFVWRFPLEDRPFAWLLFSVGYGLAIFSITEHHVSNYILPIYMALGSFFVSLPLVLERVKQRVVWREWL